ncbi:MAG TPA: hypothetical protein VE777_06655 [Gaiellales bacterium]|jgi:hypothetical protein|nr:hypothetical protein [Gaiellales bacterium]
MVTFHQAIHPAGDAVVPFTVDVWALGATVCCVVLLCWWVHMQCASRCDDCGYCHVWCQCDDRRAGT